jgi:hypothetical protein
MKMLVGAGILIFMIYTTTIYTTSGVNHALQILTIYADCTDSTDGIPTWQMYGVDNGKCQRGIQSSGAIRVDCQAKIFQEYADSTCSGNRFQTGEIGPCLTYGERKIRAACEEAKFPLVRMIISNADSCSEADFIQTFYPLDQCFSRYGMVQYEGTIYQPTNSTHIKKIDVENCNNMAVKKITYTEVGKCLRLPNSEYAERFDILSAEPYSVMTDSGDDVLGENSLRKTPI